MTKQLRLEDRLGQSGAVHLDDSLLPAIGKEVQPRGDEFLAGAALANDQNRLDSGAARETCSSISRNAGASPMIGWDSGVSPLVNLAKYSEKS